VAGRKRRETRQAGSSLVKQPAGGTGVSMYRPGDLLLVQVGSVTTAKQSSFVWLRAERCDDQHQIIYGIVDGESPGLGKALNRGAKLAAGYHLVRENASVIGPERRLPDTLRK